MVGNSGDKNSLPGFANLLVSLLVSFRHDVNGQENPISKRRRKLPFQRLSNSLDQDGLAAIFEEYAPAIYKYLLRLGVYAQEADQIVGDVFARLLDKLSDEKGPRTNLRAYLFQIAYHLVVDHARERERTAPLEVAVSMNEEVESVQSMVEEKLLFEKLSIAMECNLTAEQKHVIVLRFQEDFSLKETAEILGTNVNAVKALQNRGINKLRQAMGRLDKEQQ